MRSRLMKTCLFVLAAVVLFALTVFAFGQAAPVPQPGAAGAANPPAGPRGQGALPGAQPGQGGQQPGQQPGARGAGGRVGGGRGGQPAVAAEPTPRWPDGTPKLGPPPGQNGLWNGGGGGQANIPYQPWAREMSAYRRANNVEPHTRCKPSGGPRQFLTPYGVEIVDLPELQRIYIMDIGGPHTFRTIFMDAKTHPKDFMPSYYGHSIGHWDGDTLIVDSVGFNEKFWIDRGEAPHTEQLHLIEKFTRTDMNTMKYELTVDDPGAYTATWSRSSTMTFRTGTELFEYICQDNNFAPDLLVGTQESVDRTSVIVP